MIPEGDALRGTDKQVKDSGWGKWKAPHKSGMHIEPQSSSYFESTEQC